MNVTTNSWRATAPANIALIKYMGKSEGNLATNVSLSYAAGNFFTDVVLTLNKKQDNLIDNTQILSAKEKFKYLSHLERIKNYFSFDGYFNVTSVNNFPASCGLASSASSFAALTMAAAKAITNLSNQSKPEVDILADLSRAGSGSSCRSFLQPWCLWQHNKIKSLDLPISSLKHYVVVVSQTKKSVSSSSAHQRVRSSLLFDDRSKRAASRLQMLLSSFEGDDWRQIYDIVRAEFFDMHALFATAQPAFNYMTAATHAVLAEVERHWYLYGDGPLVTLDAGPNVHLLFRQENLSQNMGLITHFSKRYQVIA